MFRSNTWDGSKSSNLLDELKKGQVIDIFVSLSFRELSSNVVITPLQ